jgi:hypothetical protein
MTVNYPVPTKHLGDFKAALKVGKRYTFPMSQDNRYK